MKQKLSKKNSIDWNQEFSHLFKEITKKDIPINLSDEQKWTIIERQVQ